MRATTCSTPNVSRATRAARMLELSPLLTAAKAGALDAGLAQGVAVEADAGDRLPGEAVPRRRKAVVLVDDRDVWPLGLRGYRARVEPTRPQPMITSARSRRYPATAASACGRPAGAA